MELCKGSAISYVDFAFARSSLPSAIYAWQFLCNEFYDCTHRTANPTQHSVYCVLLAPVSDLSAAATFFVLLRLLS